VAAKQESADPNDREEQFMLTVTKAAEQMLGHKTRQEVGL